MSAALGILAGAAAGYAQAKRQKKQDARDQEYQDFMKDYRAATLANMKAKTPAAASSAPTYFPQNDDDGNSMVGLQASVPEEMAAGGRVGGMGYGNCFFDGSSNDGDWQKASYKK